MPGTKQRIQTEKVLVGYDSLHHLDAPKTQLRYYSEHVNILSAIYAFSVTTSNAGIVV